jgi:transcription elongation GreA/GreB family factor
MPNNTTTTLSVGPIQNYAAGSTWFDQGKYNFLASQERTSLNLSRSNLWLVDTSKIKFVEDYAPRVGFLNEGAGYRSPVKISAQGQTFSQATVFQDLSGRNSILPSANAPLSKGDWVQLSNIAAGSQVDFSVVPNGVVNPSARALSTNYAINPTSSFNPNGPVFWAGY